MARATTDAVQFTGINTNTSPFVLHGGRYGMDVKATFNSGSVSLQKLCADGATYATVVNDMGAATSFSTAGYRTADLPAGAYRIMVVAATGVFVSLQRVPAE